VSEHTDAEKSPLISEALEAQLRSILAPLQKPVTLVFLGGADEKSEEMRRFLLHFTSLSPSLLLREPDDGQKELLDAAFLPATGLWNEGGFCRAVFHGVPGGHELSSFVTAVLAAGGAAKPLDKPTFRDIAKIRKPVVLQICISLGCQHCARLVMDAQRTALENSNVTAHMIDANLYPQLVEQYEIQRVPVVVSGGKVLAIGGMTLPELCTLLRKTAS